MLADVLVWCPKATVEGWCTSVAGENAEMNARADEWWLMYGSQCLTDVSESIKLTGETVPTEFVAHESTDCFVRRPGMKPPWSRAEF
jgi:hypothetical protein